MPIPQDAFQNWTVVVVEDDPDSLMVVTMLLEMHGATVISASNGQEGLEVIQAHRPRFVISDLSMPEMSGWELIETLKQGDRPIAEIPVIALTAHAMDYDRRRAINAGFQNFITKPLQPEKFIKQIVTFLAIDIPELEMYALEA
jgi:CheY-like chemotaxis protein